MPQLKVKYICQMSSPSDQTYGSIRHEHCSLQLMQFIAGTMFSRREIGFYTHIYQNFSFKLCVVMVLAPTLHPRNGFSREFENCQGGGEQHVNQSHAVFSLNKSVGKLIFSLSSLPYYTSDVNTSRKILENRSATTFGRYI